MISEVFIISLNCDESANSIYGGVNGASPSQSFNGDRREMFSTTPHRSNSACKRLQQQYTPHHSNSACKRLQQAVHAASQQQRV